TSRTGNKLLFSPDPGFDYNPGKAWAQFDTNNTGKTKRPPIEVAPDQKTWKDLGLQDIRNIPNEQRPPPPELLPKAHDLESALAQLRTALGVSEANPLRTIETPVDPVMVRNEWLSHLVEKRPHAREEYANFILPTLTNPHEVWLTRYIDGSYRKHYIGIYQHQQDLLIIVQENTDGSLLWNIIRTKDAKINGKRKGELLWPKQSTNTAGG
ncbi:PBECR2 nuclease fold domain-containing protein, partial [Candidatus Magnetaquicoccus inordinatus]|uniref:PBECR2 nuclease fold domain-containing protein n=1 Tax=Candidatus Magnetaquicoccus inordinatus TaxID=2496818 RepID=UPI00187D43C3